MVTQIVLLSAQQGGCRTPTIQTNRAENLLKRFFRRCELGAPWWELNYSKQSIGGYFIGATQRHHWISAAAQGGGGSLSSEPDLNLDFHETHCQRRDGVTFL